MNAVDCCNDFALKMFSKLIALKISNLLLFLQSFNLEKSV